MFKIARTVKQIFNVARNVHKASSTIMNNIFKYSSGSKGYIEDARDELTFESFTKILPNQSAAKDQFKSFAPIFQSTAKLGSKCSSDILNAADIRKLIYARLASEIELSQKKAEENRNLETKSHEVKEYVETFTTCNIADEFKEFKSQGYDFKSVANLIEQKQGVVVNDREAGKSSNISSSSLLERMKELSISGYISRYAGEQGLRQDIEEVIIQKELVINEFMNMFADEIEVHSVELIG